MRTQVEVAGMSLELRKMDPADMLDLIEAAGDNAGNQTWLRFAMLPCSVMSLNGIPVPFPRDVPAIKALARRLGTEVLDAVRQEVFGEDDSADEDLTAKN